MSTALTTYAHDISKLHDKAQQHAGMAIQCAIEAGEKLIEAKSSVKHGGWMAFVESTGIGIRTAQGYMKLSKSNTQGLAHLGIEGALKALAEPKATPVFQPPVIGEHLEFTCGRYREYVWPYDDNTYHYLYEYTYLDKRGEEMGYPMIHTTLKPVPWGEIRDRVSNIKKMKRSTGYNSLAILWRDNCWLGSGMNAEEFASNNVADTRRAERFGCDETGMADLEWGGADEWEEMIDTGFKVVGLIFPEMKKDTTLEDWAFRLEVGEINLKGAFARKCESQRELVRRFKAAKEGMKMDDKAFDGWCKKNGMINVLKHPQEVEF